MSDVAETRPRRRTRRPRRRRVWLVLLLCVALVAVQLWWLLATASGLEFALRMSSRALPGTLEARVVHGSLLGPLELADLEWQAPGHELEVRQLRVDWRAAALLERRLDVSALSASEVRLALLEAAPDSAVVQQLRLPPFVVRWAMIRELELVWPGLPRPLRVRRLELATRQHQQRLEIARFDLSSDSLELQLEGRLGLAHDEPSELELDYALQHPGLAPLRGRGWLRGDRERVTLAQRLEQPARIEVSGTVDDPLGRRVLDLELDLHELDPVWLHATLPNWLLSGRLALAGTLERLSASGSLVAAGTPVGELQLELDAARVPAGIELRSLTAARPDAGGLLRAGGRIRLDDSQAAPWLDLELSLVQLDPTRWWAGSPAWPLNAELSLRGAADSPRLRGRLGLTRMPAGVLEADLDARIGAGRVELSRLELSQPGTDRRVGVSGELALAPRLSGRLVLSWSRVQWPLEGQPLWRSPGGEGLVSGTLDAWRAQLEAELMGAGQRLGRWQVAASGDRRGAELERLELRLDQAAASGRGRMEWAPRPVVRFEGQVARVDLGRWLADWPSSLSGRLVFEGALSGQAKRARLALDELSGQLRGRELEARGELEYDAGRLTARALRVDWADDRLSVDGSLDGQMMELEGRLSVGDLGLLHPQLSGGLEASGRVEGPRSAPALSVRASAKELGWRQLSARELELELELPRARQAALHARLRGGQLAWAGHELGGFEFAGAGTRGAHRFEFGLGSEPSLKLRLDGGLVGGSWSGRLVELELRQPDWGELSSWRLDARSALALSSQQQLLERACLGSGRGRLCAELDWQPGADRRLTLELEQLDAGALARTLFLPSEEAQIDGHFDGRLVVAVAADDLVSGELRLRPDEVAVSVVLEDGQTRNLPLRSPEGLWVVSGEHGVEAGVELEIGGGRLFGELSSTPLVLGAALAEHPLQARLQAELPRLTALELLLPASQIEGRLDALLGVDGTLAEPRLSGRLEVSEASAHLPMLGVVLEQGSASLVGNRSGRLQLEAELRSGPGTLRLEGEVQPLGSGEHERLTLSGERVLVADTGQARVLVTPRLELIREAGQVHLSGRIGVPEAQFNVTRLSESVVRPSEDVRVLNREQSQREALPLSAEVSVQLGDDVALRAFGLDSRLEGQLTLVEEPRRPTRARGELRLRDGSYRAFGTDLTLERGRLVFNGAVDRPVVSLRAFRDAADNVRAGVDVDGPLSDPQLRVWSLPPLSETDALSYLIFGQSASTTSEAEAETLGRAAAVVGGNLLARGVGGRLGLDKATVDMGRGVDDAALVLGKYLTPRLFVAYGIGLFDAADSLRLRYVLSRRWSVEARTGEDSSGDILYTIERGGKPPAEPSEPARDPAAAPQQPSAAPSAGTPGADPEAAVP